VSATVLYMSMSLDGFVAGPNESPDNGLGDGGDRLHEWFSAGAATGHGGVPGRPEGINGAMMDEAMEPARLSPAGVLLSRRVAGAATTTTACRSSSSAAISPAPRWSNGRW
jgi:hypothetical protein